MSRAFRQATASVVWGVGLFGGIVLVLRWVERHFQPSDRLAWMTRYNAGLARYSRKVGRVLWPD